MRAWALTRWHKSYVQVAIQAGDHLGLGGVGPCMWHGEM